MQTSVVIKCDSTHPKALGMLGTQNYFYYLYYSAESRIQQNQSNQPNKQRIGSQERWILHPDLRFPLMGITAPSVLFKVKNSLYVLSPVCLSVLLLRHILL